MPSAPTADHFCLPISADLTKWTPWYHYVQIYYYFKCHTNALTFSLKLQGQQHAEQNKFTSSHLLTTFIRLATWRLIYLIIVKGFCKILTLVNECIYTRETKLKVSIAVRNSHHWVLNKHRCIFYCIFIIN